MRADVPGLLRCPACGAGGLSSSAFRPGEDGEVRDGVVWCAACGGWYPVEDGLLDLLVGELAYADDRRRFAAAWADRLAALGLAPDAPPDGGGDLPLQRLQQDHFDWWADNEVQTYTEFEEMPFWRAVNRRSFARWGKELRPGGRLLEVGCAQGRSTFTLLDYDLDIVALDLSKVLLRQAVARYREGGFRGRASFVAADADRFPFADEAFDHVLATGVLHHLPDPARACREIARVLAPGGIYFGTENNRTVFRAIFEWVQKRRPLWQEEAGPEPLMSGSDFAGWFASTGVEVTTRTGVFVPPHLIDALSADNATRLLAFSDRLCGALGPLRHHGGLIHVRGVKVDGTISP